MVDPGEERGFFRISFQDIQVASRAVQQEITQASSSSKRLEYKYVVKGPNGVRYLACNPLDSGFNQKISAKAVFFYGRGGNMATIGGRPLILVLGEKKRRNVMLVFFSCLEPKKGMFFILFFPEMQTDHRNYGVRI